jgi:hypothetical protein
VLLNKKGRACEVEAMVVVANAESVVVSSAVRGIFGWK